MGWPRAELAARWSATSSPAKPFARSRDSDASRSSPCTWRTDPRESFDLAPHEARGSRAGDEEDLRRRRMHQLEERPGDEPREVRGRALIIVEHDEDRDLPQIVGEHAGDHLRVRRPMFGQEILQAPTAEPGEED